MRQLFWKEWHELRLLPLAAAICMALLIFGARVFLKDSNRVFQFSDTFPAILVCWAFFGLLSAAPLFSQEVGEGSLVLLSALPVSRSRIWGVKAITGFVVMALCLLTSAVAWAVLCAVLFGHGLSHLPLWHDRSGEFVVTVVTSILAAALAFATALAVSPFLDRPLSVLFAALLLFLGIFSIMVMATGSYLPYFGMFYVFGPGSQFRNATGVLLLLVTLTIPVFGTVSYVTFVRGETLRSSKRFRIGALVGSASLTFAALIFCFGSCLHWW